MSARPAQQRTTLTLADRVAYQRAIEEVYWRHRIWPKERPNPKPSLDQVMPSAQLEKKVEDYLRNSEALEDYWQQPLSAEQLQGEMERMAQHTKQPEVLRELFQALGNDPFVIAECLARAILAERLLAKSGGGSSSPLLDGKSNREAIKNSSPFAFPAITHGAADPPAISMPQDNVTYRIPEILDGCADDSWTATTTVNVPSGRAAHTAVWTGSEMIVWGGLSFGPDYLNTGGRYNPSTDSWIATSTTNAPSARDSHTAIWTGSEMIVWGGYDGTSDLNTGGRYNPGTDSWTATSTINAPSDRHGHTAVWTGSEMIIWGGYAFSFGHDFNTGGRYNPSTDSWTVTSTTNVPATREYCTVIWSGTEMIIWGGYNDIVGDVNTGARYNPSTDSWTATSTTNAPSGRDSHTAVWTASEMIVWGGFVGSISSNTGGRYNPDTDSWTATGTTNVPSGRPYHTAVWTGNEMIIWGGFGESGLLNTGGRYNPGTDSWAATSTTNAPDGRYSHTAVWSGSEMIVWGGYDGSVDVSTGGRYCAQSPLMAQSAFSRKTHGAAGTFDIPLPLTGNVGVECRSGGDTNDYQMIINFMTNVTVQSASVTSGTGSVSSFTVNGSQITVNLTGVINVQRILVTLFGVNDGTHMANVSVSMGVLVGDVNGNAVVNASDVSLTKSQVGQAVSGSNFREDVNANGLINSVDVAQVKANVGSALPP